MTAPRRMGTETSKTRLLLLDTVERLMLEEGYAAVGIRRVARGIGVTPALVHYYFRTLDDLFLAVLRRRFEHELQAQARALDSDQPLRALWNHGGNPAGAALNTEFIALSNHRKTIRSELADQAKQLRTLQMQALERHLNERGIDPAALPPLALTVLVSMLSRALAMEDIMGLTMGHAEILTLVERYLRMIDGAPAEEAE